MSDEEPKKDAYEFSIAGFNLKLNSAFLAMAIPVASAIGGAMWAGFEFYKDYMDMKAKIQEYVAPDLSDFDKRLAVLEKNSQAALDYTSEIKTDLKGDIRRNESVTEQVERGVKQAQREMDQDIKIVRNDMDQLKRTLENKLETKLERLAADVDGKIRKAIENPLAN